MRVHELPSALADAFNILTTLLALRILAAYFEVFGSLLDTGLGLVLGGPLTLLIAWWWQLKDASGAWSV